MPPSLSASHSGHCLILFFAMKMLCRLSRDSPQGLVAFRTQLSFAQQEAYLETASARVDDFVRAHDASLSSLVRALHFFSRTASEFAAFNRLAP
jgi:hypothetical protein